VFAVLLGRGIWLALHTTDMFARLLIMGCVVVLAAALMINLGAAMGLLPTKGMPLPFVSYGGSALFGECVLMGLLLSVQRHQPGNKRIEGKTGRIKHKKTARKKPVMASADEALEHLF
jgi:cell division protein FtsW